MTGSAGGAKLAGVTQVSDLLRLLKSDWGKAMSSPTGQTPPLSKAAGSICSAIAMLSMVPLNRLRLQRRGLVPLLGFALQRCCAVLGQQGGTAELAATDLANALHTTAACAGIISMGTCGVDETPSAQAAAAVAACTARCTGLSSPTAWRGGSPKTAGGNAQVSAPSSIHMQAFNSMASVARNSPLHSHGAHAERLSLAYFSGGGGLVSALVQLARCAWGQLHTQGAAGGSALDGQAGSSTASLVLCASAHAACLQAVGGCLSLLPPLHGPKRSSRRAGGAASDTPDQGSLSDIGFGGLALGTPSSLNPLSFMGGSLHSDLAGLTPPRHTKATAHDRSRTTAHPSSSTIHRSTGSVASTGSLPREEAEEQMTCVVCPHKGALAAGLLPHLHSVLHCSALPLQHAHAMCAIAPCHLAAWGAVLALVLPCPRPGPLLHEALGMKAASSSVRAGQSSHAPAAALGTAAAVLRAAAAATSSQVAASMPATQQTAIASTAQALVLRQTMGIGAQALVHDVQAFATGYACAVVQCCMATCVRVSPRTGGACSVLHTAPHVQAVSTDGDAPGYMRSPPRSMTVASAAHLGAAAASPDLRPPRTPLQRHHSESHRPYPSGGRDSSLALQRATLRSAALTRGFSLHGTDMLTPNGGGGINAPSTPFVPLQGSAVSSSSSVVLSRSRLQLLVKWLLDCMAASAAHLDESITSVLASPEHGTAEQPMPSSNDGAPRSTRWWVDDAMQHDATCAASSTLGLVQQLVQRAGHGAESGVGGGGANHKGGVTAQAQLGGELACVVLQSLVALDARAAAATCSTTDLSAFLLQLAAPLQRCSAVLEGAAAAPTSLPSSLGTGSSTMTGSLTGQFNLVPAGASAAAAGDTSVAAASGLLTRLIPLPSAEEQALLARLRVTQGALGRQATWLFAAACSLVRDVAVAAAGEAVAGVETPASPRRSSVTAAGINPSTQIPNFKVNAGVRWLFSCVRSCTCALLSAGTATSASDSATALAARSLAQAVKRQPLVLSDALHALEAPKIVAAWLHQAAWVQFHIVQTCSKAVDAGSTVPLAVVLHSAHSPLAPVTSVTVPPLGTMWLDVQGAVLGGDGATLVDPFGEGVEDEEGGGDADEQAAAAVRTPAQQLAYDSLLPRIAGASIIPLYWSMKHQRAMAGSAPLHSASKVGGAASEGIPYLEEASKARAESEALFGGSHLHDVLAPTRVLDAVWELSQTLLLDVGVLSRMHLIADLQRITQLGLNDTPNWLWNARLPPGAIQPPATSDKGGQPRVLCTHSALSPDPVQSASLLHAVAGLLVWPALRPSVGQALATVFGTAEPALEHAARIESSTARGMNAQHRRELAKPQDYGAVKIHGGSVSPKAHSKRGIAKRLLGIRRQAAPPADAAGAGEDSLPAWTLATLVSKSSDVAQSNHLQSMASPLLSSFTAPESVAPFVSDADSALEWGAYPAAAPVQLASHVPEKLLNGWLNAGLRESRATVAQWWFCVLIEVQNTARETLGVAASRRRFAQPGQQSSASAAANSKHNTESSMRSSWEVLQPLRVWTELLSVLAAGSLAEGESVPSIGLGSEPSESRADTTPDQASAAAFVEQEHYDIMRAVVGSCTASSSRGSPIAQRKRTWQWLVRAAAAAHIPMRMFVHENTQAIVQSVFSLILEALSASTKALPAVGSVHACASSPPFTSQQAGVVQAVVALQIAAQRAATACTAGHLSGGLLVAQVVSLPTLHAAMQGSRDYTAQSGLLSAVSPAGVCISALNVACDGGLLPARCDGAVLCSPHDWPRGSVQLVAVRHSQTAVLIIDALRRWLAVESHAIVSSISFGARAGHSEGVARNLVTVLRVLRALLCPASGNVFAAPNADKVARATPVAVHAAFALVTAVAKFWSACGVFDLDAAQLGTAAAEQVVGGESLGKPADSMGVTQCMAEALLSAADIAASLCRSNADVHTTKALLKLVGMPTTRAPPTGGSAAQTPAPNTTRRAAAAVPSDSAASLSLPSRHLEMDAYGGSVTWGSAPTWLAASLQQIWLSVLSVVLCHSTSVASAFIGASSVYGKALPAENELLQRAAKLVTGLSTSGDTQLGQEATLRRTRPVPVNAYFLLSGATSGIQGVSRARTGEMMPGFAKWPEAGCSVVMWFRVDPSGGTTVMCPPAGLRSASLGDLSRQQVTTKHTLSDPLPWHLPCLFEVSDATGRCLRLSLVKHPAAIGGRDAQELYLPCVTVKSNSATGAGVVRTASVQHAARAGEWHTVALSMAPAELDTPQMESHAEDGLSGSLFGGLFGSKKPSGAAAQGAASARRPTAEVTVLLDGECCLREYTPMPAFGQSNLTAPASDGPAKRWPTDLRTQLTIGTAGSTTMLLTGSTAREVLTSSPQLGMTALQRSGWAEPQPPSSWGEVQYSTTLLQHMRGRVANVAVYRRPLSAEELADVSRLNPDLEAGLMLQTGQIRSRPEVHSLRRLLHAAERVTLRQAQRRQEVNYQAIRSVQAAMKQDSDHNGGADGGSAGFPGLSPSPPVQPPLLALIPPPGSTAAFQRPLQEATTSGDAGTEISSGDPGMRVQTDMSASSFSGHNTPRPSAIKAAKRLWERLAQSHTMDAAPVSEALNAMHVHIPVVMPSQHDGLDSGFGHSGGFAPVNGLQNALCNAVSAVKRIKRTRLQDCIIFAIRPGIVDAAGLNQQDASVPSALFALNSFAPAQETLGTQQVMMIHGNEVQFDQIAGLLLGSTRPVSRTSGTESIEAVGGLPALLATLPRLAASVLHSIQSESTVSFPAEPLESHTQHSAAELPSDLPASISAWVLALDLVRHLLSLPSAPPGTVLAEGVTALYNRARAARLAVPEMIRHCVMSVCSLTSGVDTKAGALRSCFVNASYHAVWRMSEGDPQLRGWAWWQAAFKRAFVLDIPAWAHVQCVEPASNALREQIAQSVQVARSLLYGGASLVATLSSDLSYKQAIDTHSRDANVADIVRLRSLRGRIFGSLFDILLSAAGGGPMERGELSLLLLSPAVLSGERALQTALHAVVPGSAGRLSGSQLSLLETVEWLQLLVAVLQTPPPEEQRAFAKLLWSALKETEKATSSALGHSSITDMALWGVEHSADVRERLRFLLPVAAHSAEGLEHDCAAGQQAFMQQWPEPSLPEAVVPGVRSKLTFAATDLEPGEPAAESSHAGLMIRSSSAGDMSGWLHSHASIPVAGQPSELLSTATLSPVAQGVQLPSSPMPEPAQLSSSRTRADSTDKLPRAGLTPVRRRAASAAVMSPSVQQLPRASQGEAGSAGPPSPDAEPSSASCAEIFVPPQAPEGASVLHVLVSLCASPHYVISRLALQVVLPLLAAAQQLGGGHHVEPAANTFAPDNDDHTMQAAVHGTSSALVSTVVPWQVHRVASLGSSALARCLPGVTGGSSSVPVLLHLLPNEASGAAQHGNSVHLSSVRMLTDAACSLLVANCSDPKTFQLAALSATSGQDDSQADQTWMEWLQASAPVEAASENAASWALGDLCSTLLQHLSFGRVPAASLTTAEELTGVDAASGAHLPQWWTPSLKRAQPQQSVAHPTGGGMRRSGSRGSFHSEHSADKYAISAAERSLIQTGAAAVNRSFAHTAVPGGMDSSFMGALMDGRRMAVLLSSGLALPAVLPAACSALLRLPVQMQAAGLRRVYELVHTAADSAGWNGQLALLQLVQVPGWEVGLLQLYGTALRAASDSQGSRVATNLQNIMENSQKIIRDVLCTAIRCGGQLHVQKRARKTSVSDSEGGRGSAASVTPRGSIGGDTWVDNHGFQSDHKRTSSGMSDDTGSMMDGSVYSANVRHSRTESANSAGSFSIGGAPDSTRAAATTGTWMSSCRSLIFAVLQSIYCLHAAEAPGLLAPDAVSSQLLQEVLTELVRTLNLQAGPMRVNPSTSVQEAAAADSGDDTPPVSDADQQQVLLLVQGGSRARLQLLHSCTSQTSPSVQDTPSALAVGSFADSARLWASALPRGAAVHIYLSDMVAAAKKDIAVENGNTGLIGAGTGSRSAWDMVLDAAKLAHSVASSPGVFGGCTDALLALLAATRACTQVIALHSAQATGMRISPGIDARTADGHFSRFFRCNNNLHDGSCVANGWSEAPTVTRDSAEAAVIMLRNCVDLIVTRSTAAADARCWDTVLATLSELGLALRLASMSPDRQQRHIDCTRNAQVALIKALRGVLVERIAAAAAAVASTLPHVPEADGAQADTASVPCSPIQELLNSTDVGVDAMRTAWSSVLQEAGTKAFPERNLRSKIADLQAWWLASLTGIALSRTSQYNIPCESVVFESSAPINLGGTRRLTARLSSADLRAIHLQDACSDVLWSGHTLARSLSKIHARQLLRMATIPSRAAFHAGASAWRAIRGRLSAPSSAWFELYGSLGPSNRQDVGDGLNMASPWHASSESPTSGPVPGSPGSPRRHRLRSESSHRAADERDIANYSISVLNTSEHLMSNRWVVSAWADSILRRNRLVQLAGGSYHKWALFFSLVPTLPTAAMQALAQQYGDSPSTEDVGSEFGAGAGALRRPRLHSGASSAGGSSRAAAGRAGALVASSAAQAHLLNRAAFGLDAGSHDDGSESLAAGWVEGGQATEQGTPRADVSMNFNPAPGTDSLRSRGQTADEISLLDSSAIDMSACDLSATGSPIRPAMLAEEGEDDLEGGMGVPVVVDCATGEVTSPAADAAGEVVPPHAAGAQLDEAGAIAADEPATRSEKATGPLSTSTAKGTVAALQPAPAAATPKTSPSRPKAAHQTLPTTISPFRQRKFRRKTPSPKRALADNTPLDAAAALDELQFDALLLACISFPSSGPASGAAASGAFLALMASSGKGRSDIPAVFRDMAAKMADSATWFGVSPEDKELLVSKKRSLLDSTAGGHEVVGMTGSMRNARGSPSRSSITARKNLDLSVLTRSGQPSGGLALVHELARLQGSTGLEAPPSRALHGGPGQWNDGSTTGYDDDNLSVAYSESSVGTSAAGPRGAARRKLRASKFAHRAYMRTASTADAHGDGGSVLSGHGRRETDASSVISSSTDAHSIAGGGAGSVRVPRSKSPKRSKRLLSALCECVTPLQSTIGVVEVHSDSIVWRRASVEQAALFKRYALGRNHWSSETVPKEVRLAYGYSNTEHLNRVAHPMELWLDSEFGGDVAKLHHAVASQVGAGVGAYARQLNKHSILQPLSGWRVSSARVASLERRRFMMHDTGVEVFASPGASSGGSFSWFLSFPEPSTRDLFVQQVLSTNKKIAPYLATDEDVQRVAQRVYARWRDKSMSTFEFLMWLNRLAGRSYNDISQYPVFPWVLADYDSDTLDLNDPAVYRDLRFPMGAQSEHRREHTAARYVAFEDEHTDSMDRAREAIATAQAYVRAVERGALQSNDGRTPATIAREAIAEAQDKVADVSVIGPPRHYGSHFSNASCVAWSLLRQEPWTSYHVVLHDGKFDNVNRQLRSVAGAWQGATTNDSDVKELPPEWYYAPQFLRMSPGLHMGVFTSGQGGGTESMGDVELPPWAERSPSKFVTIMRAALESNHVSANLHHWVHLVFGHKQLGPNHPWATAEGSSQALEACNVYGYQLYNGPFAQLLPQLRHRRPRLWRSSMTSIDSFGQQPPLLFPEPIAPRMVLHSASVLLPMFSRYYAHSDAVDGWVRGAVGQYTYAHSLPPGALAVLEPDGRITGVTATFACTLLREFPHNIQFEAGQRVIQQGSVDFPLVVVMGPHGAMALGTLEDAVAATQHRGLVPMALLLDAGFSPASLTEDAAGAPAASGSASPVLDPAKPPGGLLADSPTGGPARTRASSVGSVLSPPASGSADTMSHLSVGAARDAAPRTIMPWLASTNMQRIVTAAWETVGMELSARLLNLFRDSMVTLQGASVPGSNDFSEASLVDEAGQELATDLSDRSDSGASSSHAGASQAHLAGSLDGEDSAEDELDAEEVPWWEWLPAASDTLLAQSTTVGVHLHSAPIVQLWMCSVQTSDLHASAAGAGSGGLHGTGTLLTLGSDVTVGLHEWTRQARAGSGGADLFTLALDVTLPPAKAWMMRMQDVAAARPRSELMRALANAAVTQEQAEGGSAFASSSAAMMASGESLTADEGDEGSDDGAQVIAPRPGGTQPARAATGRLVSQFQSLPAAGRMHDAVSAFLRLQLGDGRSDAALLRLVSPFLARLPVLAGGVSAGGEAALSPHAHTALRAFANAHTRADSTLPRSLAAVRLAPIDVLTAASSAMGATAAALTPPNLLPPGSCVLSADATHTGWVQVPALPVSSSKGRPAGGARTRERLPSQARKTDLSDTVAHAGWMRPWMSAVLSSGRHLVTVGHSDATLKVHELGTGAPVASVSASGSPTLCVATAAIGRRPATVGAVGALAKQVRMGVSTGGPMAMLQRVQAGSGGIGAAGPGGGTASPAMGMHGKDGVTGGTGLPLRDAPPAERPRTSRQSSDSDGASTVRSSSTVTATETWVDASGKDDALFVDGPAWTRAACDLIAVGSADASIRLWLATPNEVIPRPRLTLRTHRTAVTCVALDTRLDLLVSCSADGLLCVHSLHNGRCLHKLYPCFPASTESQRGPPALEWCGVTSAGDILAYADSPPMLWSFSCDGEANAPPVAVQQAARSFALSEDGQQVLVGGTWHYITVFHVRTLALLQVIGSGGCPVHALPVEVEDVAIGTAVDDGASAISQLGAESGGNGDREDPQPEGGGMGGAGGGLGHLPLVGAGVAARSSDSGHGMGEAGRAISDNELTAVTILRSNSSRGGDSPTARAVRRLPSVDSNSDRSSHHGEPAVSTSLDIHPAGYPIVHLHTSDSLDDGNMGELSLTSAVPDPADAAAAELTAQRRRRRLQRLRTELARATPFPAAVTSLRLTRGEGHLMVGLANGQLVVFQTDKAVVMRKQLDNWLETNFW